MQYIKYLFQSKFIRNTINLAWNNPIKFGGIVVGSTIFTIGALYKYGISLGYRIGSIIAIPYFNEKVSEFAMKKNNVGLYDITATIAEQLNKILPSWFSKIDSNKALESAVKNLNLEMVNAAMMHEPNLNRESEAGIRPVELALNKGKQNELGYVITQQLIVGNADLSIGAQCGQENLFYQVIKRGKKELVEAAMTQATLNTKLVDSTNAEGNTIAHLIPVSSDLQEIALNADLFNALTPRSVSITNVHGKTAIDVAMYAYKKGKEKYGSKVDPKLMYQYVNLGTHKAIQPHFGCLVQWFHPNIVNVAISKHGFNFNEKDGAGKLPLDYVLQFGNDDLSEKVTSKTNSLMMVNHHVLLTYQKDFKKTRIKISEILFTTNQAKQDFLTNPTGKNTGTILHLMAEGAIRCNIEEFIVSYNFLKKHTNMNPLKNTNHEGLNVLTVAVKYNNMPIYKKIMDIITKEGLQGDHLPLLVDKTFLCFVHDKHNMIEYAQNTMLTSSDVSLKSIVKNLMTSIPAISSNAEIKQIEYKEQPNSSVVSVIKKPNTLLNSRSNTLANMKEMKQFRKQRQKSQADITLHNKEKHDQYGIPKEVTLTNIEYTQAQPQQEDFIIGGMLTKQLVMFKGFFVNEREGILPTLMWSGIFFAGGYCEAYGRNYQNPLALASIGAGTYCYTELFRRALYTEYTTPEERGIFDFCYKYGSYITMGIPESILYQIAFATTGGIIGGWPGMLKSSSVVVGIRTMQSYNIYTTEPNIEKVTGENYYTFENILVTGVALYVGWNSMIELSASTTAISATPNALTIGKFTLNVLSLHSKICTTFIVAKLASSTFLPAIKSETFVWVKDSVKESTQYIAITLDENYKVTLDSIYSTVQFIKEAMQDFYYNIAILGKDVYEIALDQHYSDTFQAHECPIITLTEVFRKHETCYVDDLTLNF